MRHDLTVIIRAGRRWAPMLLLLLLTCGAAHAAGAPTREEWAPLRERIAADPVASRQQMRAFMTNRIWPDGWLILAKLDRRVGDYAAVRQHALSAFDQFLEADSERNEVLDRRIAESAWLAIEAFNRLGRSQEGTAVLVRLGDRPDPGGLAHYHAALGALARSEAERAAELLQAAADQRDGGQGLGYKLAWLRVHELRAEAAGDAATAAAQLRRAAEVLRSLPPDQLDGPLAYRLGSLLRTLAGSDPEHRDALLHEAVEAFRTARNQQPDDAEAALAQGLVLLDLGRQREAYHAFSTALSGELAPSRQAVALRGRGSAQLRLSQDDPLAWQLQPAIDDLERAQQLGDEAADLLENLLVGYLALAQDRSLDERERSQVSARIADLSRRAPGLDPVNRALAAILAASRAAAADPGTLAAVRSAIDMLAVELGITGIEPQDWQTLADGDRAIWRWFGHGHHLEAELLTSVGSDQARIEAARDRAAMAWTIAGTAGDHHARQHLLAAESRRDPERAFTAAWRHLSWSGWLSAEACLTLVANYGAAERWRDPIHLGIWGGLLALLLLATLSSAGSKRRRRRLAEELRKAQQKHLDPQTAAVQRRIGTAAHRRREEHGLSPTSDQHRRTSPRPSPDQTHVPAPALTEPGSALERHRQERREATKRIGKPENTEARRGRQAVEDVARRLAGPPRRNDRQR